MSRINVQRFHEKLQQGDRFFQLFLEALRDVPDAQRDQAIKDFAGQQGFDFSLDELRRFLDELRRLRDGQEVPDTEDSPTDDTHNTSTSRGQSSAESFRNTDTSQPKPKLSVGPLEKFFIWLAGASPIILASCPDSEQRKQAAVGGTILIPALMSIIMSSFLLSTLGASVPIRIVVSALWMIIILMMDRALIATFRKRFSISQIGLRVVIALLIAFTVSHPVMLFLFEKTIMQQYEMEFRKTSLDQWDNNCGKEMDAKEKEIKDTEEVIEKSAGPQENCAKAGVEIEIADSPKLKELQDKSQRLNQELNVLNENYLHFNQEENIELAGGGGQTLDAHRGIIQRRGISGHGPRSRYWHGLAEQTIVDMRIKQQEIDTNQQDIDATKLTHATDIEEQKRTAQQQCEQNIVSNKAERDKVYELQLNKLTTLKERDEEYRANCKKERDEINKPPDILMQTKLLHKYIGSEPKDFVFNAGLFFVFFALFLLIDVLAIVLKISSYGIYESKVDHAEYNNLLAGFCENRYQTFLRTKQSLLSERKQIDSIQCPLLKQESTKQYDNLVKRLSEADRQRQQLFFEKKKKWLSGFFRGKGKSQQGSD